jgi:putative redox protein
MPSPPSPRALRVERTALGRFTAVNERGGRIPFATGTDDRDEFTPIELLLAAIAGCTALDVDALTSRRAEPESFAVDVHADKIRDEHGNRLTDIEVTFRVAFPEGADGDAARDVLPEAVRRSHDRLCTVSRTVEVGVPIVAHIAAD